MNSDIQEAPKWRPFSESDPTEAMLRYRRIGRPSAQSTVFLLPPEFNYDASPTGRFDDTVEVSRVAKVAHGTKRTALAVESLGITDPADANRKSGELISGGRYSVRTAIQFAQRAPRLDMLFGQPRLILPVQEYLGTDECHMAYTQDFCRPVADILASLDTENSETDLRKACELVDRYIDAQLYLCSQGLFDATFKLADNCGMGLHEELYGIDESRGFKIMDIGELITNLSDVIYLIETKDWRNVVHRQEYTKLPPSVQEYFNAACEKRLTVEAVKALWCKGEWQSADLSSFGSSGTERNVPDGLIQTLWQMA